MNLPRFARSAGTTLVAIIAAALLSAPATAASYPTKPIQVIVPFGPGGVTDMLARIVASELSTRLGQSVVIENRTGAGGNIGAAAAARAKPRSEEHTSELQSLMRISYAVFCLKKK